MLGLTILALLATIQATKAGSPGGRIVSMSIANSQMELLFTTTTGYSYQVQSCPRLESRFWSDTLAPIEGIGSFAQAFVPAPGQHGFVRVLEFPNRVFWYDWCYYREEPFLADWGLGAPQVGYAHLDRAYEWYIDQADTGLSSGNNCGPSSVTMALKWYDQGFSKTAEDARNTYPRDGGWWYTSDIINYLRLYSVPPTTSGFTGTDQLVGVLNQGQLVILCLNTAYLPLDNNSEHRVGRFYGYQGGHFLVVKGWRSSGNDLFFEVYDPNNWHAFYADGTPKGRNRHLRGSDLATAIENWWNYLIVIDPTSRGGASAELDAWLKPVDPEQIPHMPGM